MLPARIALYQELEVEERRRRLRRFNLERRIRRNNNDPFSLDDVEFISLFRLSKELVQVLINRLSIHLTESEHINRISPEMKIFSALYFYASGSYQFRIGQSFNLSMSQPSVSRCVNQVSTLIVTFFMEEWVKFPTTPAAKAAIKQQFMQNAGFPGVIGRIDCTHVAMIAPRTEEHNYVNRKGFHSKNVQLISDYNLKILAVNSRYAGATHDAAIWNMSLVQAHLNQAYIEGDRNSWLIGDSGYPQQPWLMTPILNTVPGSPEERYSERLRSARNCIERCNGVLKARFRCIMGERVLRYSPDKVGMIINTCVILHNMCTEARLDYPPMNDNFEEQNIAALNEPVQNLPMQIITEGRRRRTQLIEQYFTH